VDWYQQSVGMNFTIFSVRISKMEAEYSSKKLRIHLRDWCNV